MEKRGKKKGFVMKGEYEEKGESLSECCDSPSSENSENRN